LKYFSRQICVAQIAETLWAEKRLRAYKRYSFLIAMRLAVKFRFINNCKYRGLSKKLTSRTRSSIAYAGSAWSHTYAQRAKATVGAFCAQMVRTWNLNDLVYKLDDLVRFMQRKFRNRTLYKMAKLEMMESYWDLRLADMTAKAEKRKHPAMKKLCKSIAEDVKPEIKSYVLLKFLE
jgi:hypothetical protein